MDFTEVVNRRRTSRQWLKKDIDFEAIKRILEAGNQAPTWDHHRSWKYIVLHTDEEKAFAFDFAKKAADKFDAEKYLSIPRPYPVTLGQKMFAHAMPRQYTMLVEAPYVVLPAFKIKKVSNDDTFSKLNPFSTAWCVIENIFLAAANEGLSCSMRIPLDEEHEAIKKKLKVPATFQIPCFIGIGYPDPDEPELEQYRPNVEEQIRLGKWKK